MGDPLEVSTIVFLGEDYHCENCGSSNNFLEYRVNYPVTGFDHLIEVGVGCYGIKSHSNLSTREAVLLIQEYVNDSPDAKPELLQLIDFIQKVS